MDQMVSLASVPRVRLANLPTPLQEAAGLSATLDGPRLLIKRDDMTGLVLGGNKARKLEYAMADAQRMGADVIITTGGSQSNHVSQTAAAARKLGMEPVLVLWKGVHVENQGNLFLDSLFDAEVHMIDEGLKGPLRPKTIKALAEELREQGRRPYIIQGGASNPLGSLGYVNAVQEICEQLEEQEITAQYLVCAVGSCGTIAGLIVGAEYFRAPFQVIGISVEGEKNELAGKIATLANEIAELLDMDVSFDRDKIVVYDEYVGTGYGIPTTGGIEALKLVARKEGIILDPVYTSKAMAGLMDLISQNRFTPQESVIFLHSGGAASVFTYVEEISGQKPFVQ